LMGSTKAFLRLVAVALGNMIMMKMGRVMLTNS
jgi:hypothetical protein